MPFADIEGDVEKGRDADKDGATGSGGFASDLQDNSSRKNEVSKDKTAGPPHAVVESKKLKYGTSMDNLSPCLPSCVLPAYASVISSHIRCAL